MSIEKWLRANSLKMNPPKRSFSLLGTRQASTSFFFEMDVHRFTPSKNIKVLGVIIDHSLTWDLGEPGVTGSPPMYVSTCILVSLYRLRRHFTTEALLTIIRAHVFSHILYCLSVWASASGNQLKRIQKLLHFATRVVTGARRTDHMSPVLRSLGWLDIRDAISERDCTRVFRALNNPDAPRAMHRLVTRRRDTVSRDTRLARSDQLELPRVRLAATQRIFSYHAATSWNLLPEDVLQSSSIEELKGRLRAIVELCDLDLVISDL